MFLIQPAFAESFKHLSSTVCQAQGYILKLRCALEEPTIWVEMEREKHTYHLLLDRQV